MTFLNAWEIDELVHAYGTNNNNLGRAVRLLAAVRDDADCNSDGWCYWPKPAHASRKLIELLRVHVPTLRPAPHYGNGPASQPTDAELRAATSPIKAFYTKHRKLRGYGTGKPYPEFPALAMDSLGGLARRDEVRP